MLLVKAIGLKNFKTLFKLIHLLLLLSKGQQGEGADHDLQEV